MTNTRARCAVVFKTYAWDDFVERQARRLAEAAGALDFYYACVVVFVIYSLIRTPSLFSVYDVFSGNAQEDVDEAERLCKDLVETVRAEYERMKSRPPMQQEPYGQNRHYGGRSVSD